MVRATIQEGANVAVEEYKYDWKGNRIRKSRELDAVNYLVDTNNWISHVVAETDGTGTLLAFYTRGGDGLISMARGNVKSWYLFDGHGSVRMLANGSGLVTDTWDFDAWGEVTARTGVTENDYLYAGERFDRTTELYQLRARYMDPKTGAFLSLDPYQGNRHDPLTLHKYMYANANPINNADPTGMWSMSDIGTALGIQGILHGGVMVKAFAVLGLLSAGAHGVRLAVSVRDFVIFAIEGDVEGMLHALSNGLVSIMGIISVCECGMVAQLLSRALAAYGAYESAQDFTKAVEEGDVSEILFSGANFFLDLAVAFASCFDGDTPVATEDGFRRIDEIQVGDRVWSCNVETGETALKEVEEVFVLENDELLHIETSRGNIDATTNHPFYVLGKGWISAGDLAIGDAFHALSDDVGIVTGLTLEKLAAPVLVYNLEVEDFQSYFVGDGVLVHNKCWRDKILEATGQPKPENWAELHGHHVLPQVGYT